MSFNVPRREGLFQIDVNQEVEFELSYYNHNKWGKKQFSGFIGDKFYYLPTHQQLVDKLEKIERGSRVKVKRLTLGNAKEACKYDVKIISSPKNSQQTLDSYKTGVTVKEEPDNATQMLKTVMSCLKNNCSAGQIIMILQKEYGEDEVKKMGL